MSRFSEYDPSSCLNCGERFDPETTFCPSCGQKNRKNELKLMEWIREGLSTFLHLEGRTWNTIRDLPAPGKIAINYFNGQRQRYVHPFRLLVFSSLICFGLISLARYYSPDSETMNFVQIEDKSSDEVNSSSTSYSSPAIINNIREHPVAERMRDIDLLRTRFISHDRFNLIADSMRRAGASQDSAQLALLDSIQNFYPVPTDNLFGPEGHLTIAGDTLNLDNRSVATDSPAEVIEKSNVKAWLSRLVGKKVVAAYQGGAATLSQQLNANLSWAVLLYVPLLAFGYFILYRKRLPLYTQHLTYIAILMSVLLLFFGLSTLIDSILGFRLVALILLLVFIVYNFVSDQRVFEVGPLHAFGKINLLGFYGFFAFLIAVLIWLFGTMLLI